jgi:tRNA A-37 threonylcarbamoyl transferase component Bud32/membrane-associated phospholipid phosphatase
MSEYQQSGHLGSELGGIGARRELRIGSLRFSGRRRRPSGEKPPLPRELRASGWFWIITGVIMVGVWISLFVFTETTNWWTDRDMTVLRWLQDLRTDGVTKVMDGLHSLGSQWFIRPLRWATILILIYYKRWRHLFGMLGALFIVMLVVNGLELSVARPRPLVDIIGPWTGYSHPSAPVAGLAVTFGVMGMSLFPKGKARNRFMTGAEVVVGLQIVARLYLGVDHPSDAIFAALLGFAVAVLVFKLFVPESVFPVVYKRGVSAHLDVGGDRGTAIKQAVQDQLGIEVLGLEPFGLEGSGGSTPLRLTVPSTDPEEPEVHLFAKLYSQTHLRSDRWYKVGRTILYGSLEDEVKFSSVRRLVEYEDYILLRMQEAGLPSAEPYGIVEITPEREYLLVTEFLLGAEELGDAIVDDSIIDQGLVMIRKLWDAGLAHRDIKPANVMVHKGEVKLIDVAFATVRPSPWRQAVDLANMMIILGLRHDPSHVYEAALRYFTPDDVAEAFAATSGITVPTQSRSAHKQYIAAGEPDLIQTFRDMAPPCEPISVQRWSRRRLGLTAVAVMTALWFAGFVVDNLTGAGFV